MRLLLTLSFLAALSLLFYPSAYASKSPELKLSILPIDCVFETINDGKNTINYITPKECGVVVKQNPILLDTLSNGGAGTLDVPVVPLQLAVPPLRAVETNDVPTPPEPENSQSLVEHHPLPNGSSPSKTEGQIQTATVVVGSIIVLGVVGVGYRWLYVPSKIIN